MWYKEEDISRHHWNHCGPLCEYCCLVEVKIQPEDSLRIIIHYGENGFRSAHDYGFSARALRDAFRSSRTGIVFTACLSGAAK